MSSRGKFSAYSPQASSSGMGGGCIAAIVIGCIAVVCAIVVIVLYATNGKTNTLVVENIPARDVPIVTSLAQNYRADRQPVVIKPQAPATSLAQTSALPAAIHAVAQAPSYNPLKPPAASAPAPSHSPIPLPQSLARNDTFGSVKGIQDAVAVANSSSRFADATNKIIERVSTPVTHEDVAGFNNSKLHSLIHDAKGSTLANKAMRQENWNTAFDNSDTSLAALGDEEGHEKLNKALKITASPRFFESEAESHVRNRESLLATMRLQGKVDPSAEEVLAVAPVTSISHAAIKKRIMAATDRDMIVTTPLRFTYLPQVPRPGPPPPLAVISPLALESGSITPGQENYMIQNSCGGGITQSRMEGY